VVLNIKPCSTPLVLGKSNVINVVPHLTVTVKALCSTPLVLGESNVINGVPHLTVTVKALCSTPLVLRERVMLLMLFFIS
jgi:hypothetical protein